MPIVPPMPSTKKPESELAKRLRELLERSKKPGAEEQPVTLTNPNAPPAEREALVERNEISEQECHDRVMRDPSAWTGVNIPGMSDNQSILPR